jgi:hypothetical protein
VTRRRVTSRGSRKSLKDYYRGPIDLLPEHKKSLLVCCARLYGIEPSLFSVVGWLFCWLSTPSTVPDAALPRYPTCWIGINTAEFDRLYNIKIVIKIKRDSSLSSSSESLS